MGINATKLAWPPVETPAQANVRLVHRVAQLEHEAVQARHLAYHDALTGLPNRTLLLDRLEQAMMQARRQHKAVGLLLLDLDRFKSVNDRFGHQAGDLLLQQVATRLLGCIRGCDTACRYGGDEFVVMLPEIDGAADAEAVEEKLRTRLSAPYQLGEQLIEMRTSIGAAVFDADGVTCDALIGAADAAMYRAKARSVTAVLRRSAVWEAGISSANTKRGDPESAPAPYPRAISIDELTI